MDIGGATTLYRIIQARQPIQYDFWSPERRGQPLRSENLRYMYSGVSMYGTVSIAVSKALRYPQLGSWIAEIDLTNSGNLRVEQTGRRRLRHYTVWAEPDDLLGCVARVISIAESLE